MVSGLISKLSQVDQKFSFLCCSPFQRSSEFNENAMAMVQMVYNVFNTHAQTQLFETYQSMCHATVPKGAAFGGELV